MVGLPSDRGRLRAGVGIQASDDQYVVAGTVQTIQPDHPRLAASALTVLQRERHMRAEQMVKVRAKTFEDYQYQVGLIEGLDVAISLLKQVDDKLNA